MSRAMLSVCVLVLAMCAPLRPALAEVARLQGVMVTEVEMERTLVSKPGWLRGLHFLSQAGTEITGPHIRVVLPGIWAGEKLCARITTLSGGYAAVVEYQVPADLAGNQDYVLDFEAKSDIVRQVTPENSGVSLERGPCAQDVVPDPDNRTFIASYWNQDSRPRLTDAGDIQLLLHLNIARADELQFVAQVADATLPHRCEKLIDPNALAYNFQCTIAVNPALFPSDGHRNIDIEYIRIHRTRESKPRRARILIGAGQ